ncbi:MAG: tetratricopeptide repeat protein [Candidatus Accumulibacter sp. UW26]|jgi:tetratricopeptide (TPR) repeat protein
MCSNFPKTFPKPLPTPFSALIVGLVVCFLSSASSLAIAGNLADAERLMKQGNLSQALQVVDAHIANRPRALQERFLKGLILAEMGRPTEAIAVFKALSEEFPELPEPYNNLAVLYAQQKQYDQALAVLEMAIRTHPGYAIARENLGDLHTRLAAESYDQALQLDPSNRSMQLKRTRLREFISATSPGSAQ